MKERKRKRDWESWIDQQIREAQERGHFDDLPGAGRPIDLTPNPYAQEEELGYKILKDAGYAPEWIELDKAIRGKRDRARAVMARRWEWREARLADLEARDDRWSEAERGRVLASWQQAVAAFEIELGAINKEIAELNLKVPSPRFQRAKLNLNRELDRLSRTST